MGFSVSDFVNDLSAGVISNPTINMVMRNPIYTALFIGFLVLLIIIFVFWNVDMEDFYGPMLRITAYTVFAVTIVLFVQNKILNVLTIYLTSHDNQMADNNGNTAVVRMLMKSHNHIDKGGSDEDYYWPLSVC